MFTVHDKVLVKMKNRQKFMYCEDMNRKHIPIDSTVLWQKSISLYKDFRKEFTENKDPRQFTASKG